MAPQSVRCFWASSICITVFCFHHLDVKTGNVVLGSGFDLPARFIIHAMEPGMNVKFQSAVENAVHSMSIKMLSYM